MQAIVFRVDSCLIVEAQFINIATPLKTVDASCMGFIDKEPSIVFKENLGTKLNKLLKGTDVSLQWPISRSPFVRGAGSGLEMLPLRENRACAAVGMSFLRSKKSTLVARYLHSLAKLCGEELIRSAGVIRVLPA